MVQAPSPTPSLSFARPPVDGSLSVPEIYDWHYVHNSDHALFIYPDGEDQGSTRTITFRQGVRAIHRAAARYQKYFSSLGHAPADHDCPVIALFAATDTITYVCTWLGLVRAGYIVFHISPRNSSAALAHLLKNRSAVHLLTSSEVGLQSVARAALASIDPDESRWNDYISEMPDFESLFVETDDGFEMLPARSFHPDDVIAYIHSSGTTAFPKPVPWTNKEYLNLRMGGEYSKHNWTNQILACQSVPMFHGLGVTTVVMAACFGVVLSTFKPQRPAAAMTPDAIFKAAMVTRSTYIFAVPIIIEMWARDPNKVAALAQTKGVLYGGGPLNRAAGDHLTESGVDVYGTYGSSENGMKAPMVPDPPGKDWEWIQILPSMRAEFVDYNDGTYELVTVKCPTHCPRLFNTKWDGEDAYATGDLLIPHPTKEGFWKVYGRVDDQIMLSSGEKTNPGPLEDILSRDARVHAAVMFGRGRFQNGVLVQPKPDHVFDTADVEALASFRNTIWPTVEKMNEYAPQHSRLFKEMILVASPSKPFLYTAKGTIRRAGTLEAYQSEIDALYDAVAETTLEDLAPPADASAPAILPFVRAVVASVVKVAVSDTDDLFQHGCDSLQATWIRNAVARGLRQAGARRALPGDFVYTNPSIAAMAAFCVAPVVGDQHELEAKRTAMLEFVDKYTASFPAHTPALGGETGSAGEVALVTGTTGQLGSALLAELISSATVSKVYALNRASANADESLATRQARAFEQRGLDTSLLGSDKVELLVCDMTKADMGLGSEVVEKMRNSVTSIIHNAYRVNFNLALISFEPSLLSVRTLVDFALSSPLAKPPRIVFISTIGVLRNAATDQPLLEKPFEDPSVAVGSGYSESKWVAERILARASDAAPALRTTSVRVGQLSGAANGAWSPDEWLPSMIRSGAVVKCLPEQDGDLPCIPVQDAAAAVVEMALAPSAPAVLHLEHPHPTHWTTIMSAAAELLGVTLVPYAQWLQALEDSFKDGSKSEVEHLRTNPALRLLPFFRGALHAAPPSEGRAAMGLPRMGMTKAKEVCATLAPLRVLGAADVASWLDHWKRVGAL